MAYYERKSIFGGKAPRHSVTLQRYHNARKRNEKIKNFIIRQGVKRFFGIPDFGETTEEK